MMGRHRGRAALIAACGHHYHPTEKGWACCGCPSRVRRRGDGPEPAGTADCRQGPSEESIEMWLAPAQPGWRHHRPGRRNWRRAGAA